MKQEILLEIHKLIDVVSQRLTRERPEGVDADLPLYSNKLSPKDVEQIRAGLQAGLAATVEAEGFEALVVLGRPQDENEAGSLIVTFQKL